ncbi:hypothetical protein OAO87_02650 [bacterium]|nr:hypothetical protein [bacterium]
MAQILSLALVSKRDCEPKLKAGLLFDVLFCCLPHDTVCLYAPGAGVAFLPDGGSLFVCSSDRNRLDAVSREAVPKPYNGAVTSVLTFCLPHELVAPIFSVAGILPDATEPFVALNRAFDIEVLDAASSMGRGSCTHRRPANRERRLRATTQARPDRQTDSSFGTRQSSGTDRPRLFADGCTSAACQRAGCTIARVEPATLVLWTHALAFFLCLSVWGWSPAPCACATLDFLRCARSSAAGPTPPRAAQPACACRPDLQVAHDLQVVCVARDRV